MSESEEKSGQLFSRAARKIGSGHFSLVQLVDEGHLLVTEEHDAVSLMVLELAQ